MYPPSWLYQHGDNFVELYFRRSAILLALCRLAPPIRVRENAVSLSSACTTKRFPLSRCASEIQIVHPFESIAETQPKLQPALLRLSAQLLHIERASALNVTPHYPIPPSALNYKTEIYLNDDLAKTVEFKIK